MRKLTVFILALVFLLLPCASLAEANTSISIEAFLYHYSAWLTWQNGDAAVLEDVSRQTNDGEATLTVGGVTLRYRFEDGALLSLSAVLETDEAATVRRMAALTAALSGGGTLNEAACVKWLGVCTVITQGSAEEPYQIGAYSVVIGTVGDDIRYEAWLTDTAQAINEAAEGSDSSNDTAEKAVTTSSAASCSLDQNTDVLENAADAAKADTGVLYRIVDTGGGSLKLRKTPSQKGKILARIPNGTRLEVTEVDELWCAVRYNGLVGYVMTSFLSSNET